MGEDKEGLVYRQGPSVPPRSSDSPQSPGTVWSVPRAFVEPSCWVSFVVMSPQMIQMVKMFFFLSIKR